MPVALELHLGIERAFYVGRRAGNGFFDGTYVFITDCPKCGYLASLVTRVRFRFTTRLGLVSGACCKRASCSYTLQPEVLDV